MAQILFFVKMVFLHIVLRGISGVGKTTLRNRLVEFFRAHGIQTVIFSKDIIRKELKRILGVPYSYTPHQEKLCETLYHSRLYNFLKKPCGKFANPEIPCVLISDCTNCSLKSLRDSCFYWLENEDEEYLDLLRNTKQVLIEIGNYLSNSRSKRPATTQIILMRQALALVDSEADVQDWTINKRNIPLFHIPAFSALENGVEELGEELLCYLQN